jgi:hypothetical protein
LTICNLNLADTFKTHIDLTYPYTVEGNSLNVLTGIKEKFSAYGVVSLTPLELKYLIQQLKKLPSN